MKSKIKKIFKLITLIFIVISFYLILDKNQIYIGNSNIIDFLTYNLNYLDEDKIFYLNKHSLIKVGHITNYEYKTIFYKPIPQKENSSGNNNYKESKEELVIKGNENIKEDSNIITLIPKEPIVYIYNTHQTEKYSLSNIEAHNIVPTVMTTSYMLQEQLKKNGIYSIVEENSVSNILKKNNWNYASSYKVTRTFLEKAKKDNPTLKFFIDVHRDSVSKSITTTEINKKKYARVMLLLGLENKNYNKNLKIIEYINDELNKKYPTLSRGIYKKKGPGVNGVYNQDFSQNCILIEFGGQYNTIEEVYNTVEVLSEILANYIGDYNEN